jgi:hypothetical protein
MGLELEPYDPEELLGACTELSNGANERIKCLREETKNFDNDGFIKAF